MDEFTPTERSRLRRLHERGRYDKATIYPILDAGFLCHVGYVIDGQPYVTPTSYWRDGDRLYWHGSSASRMLRAIAQAIPVCLTVCHLDGIVLARSGFHSSINYRSVMAFGHAKAIDDPREKLKSLEDFVERLHPGRWAELRPVSTQELKGTTIVSMEIEEASAKTRAGPPKDDEEDYALGVWAGVLPVHMITGQPEPDPRLVPGTPKPDYLGRLPLP
jgi:hypothetical protein